MALSTSASACEVELKAMRGAFASGWRLDRLQGARREERGVKSSDAGTSNCETRSDRPFGLGPSSPSASPTASVNTGAAAAAAAPLTFVEALVEAFVPLALGAFFLEPNALSRGSGALLLSERLCRGLPRPRTAAGLLAGTRGIAPAAGALASTPSAGTSQSTRRSRRAPPPGPQRSPGCN